MGFFSRRKNSSAVHGSLSHEPALGADNTGNNLLFSENGSKGLDSIYAFLQSDYESKGYNDALINPDESYRNDNIRLLRQDLMILIDRTVNYYETLIRETDYHISTRSRAGLLDLVDELKMKRDLLQSHIEKVNSLKAEASAESGSSQRIVLSYQRGFMRGLYAISQSKFFNGKL